MGGNFKLRIVFFEYFFGRLGDLKNDSHFLKKGTFSFSQKSAPKIYPKITQNQLTSSTNQFSEFQISNIYKEIFVLIFFELFLYLAHVMEQPIFRIPNLGNFVYLLDQQQGETLWNLYIEITQPFLILSKSQRSLKMCSQNH